MEAAQPMSLLIVGGGGGGDDDGAGEFGFLKEKTKERGRVEKEGELSAAKQQQRSPLQHVRDNYLPQLFHLTILEGSETILFVLLANNLQRGKESNC